jgi:hypothetical protein
MQKPGQVGPGVIPVLGQPAVHAPRTEVAAQRQGVRQVRLTQVESPGHPPDPVARQAARYRPQSRRHGHRTVRSAPPGDLARLESAQLVVIHAAGGIAATSAVGGPARHHEQVSGEAPRCGRLEHVVVEGEVVGPAPVVRDLAGVVVAHDVGCGGRRADRRRLPTRAAAGPFRRGHESVHGPVVHVCARRVRVVLRAAVHLVWIVVGKLAAPVPRIGHAHREAPVLRGDAVRAGEGAEVRVERAVFLHHHDHMPDPMDGSAVAWSERRRAHHARARCDAGPAAAGEYHERDHHYNQAESHGCDRGADR